MVDLYKDVKYIKGVGPNRVKLLNKIGIFTLKDLITYYPRTYEDRSKPKNLYECQEGEEVFVRAIACSRLSDIRLRGRTMQKLLIRDETATAEAMWFNQSYLKSKFEQGKEYGFYGRVSKKYVAGEACCAGKFPTPKMASTEFSFDKIGIKIPEKIPCIRKVA